MPDSSIEKLVEDTMQSFNGAERAEPKPFLFTRVMALVNRQPAIRNTWTRLGTFISRPAVAIGGVLLIMALNTVIIISSKNNADNANIAQASSAARDEFAINTTAIYEIENP